LYVPEKRLHAVILFIYQQDFDVRLLNAGGGISSAERGPVGSETMAKRFEVMYYGTFHRNLTISTNRTGDYRLYW
jgi:hypothetical protein